jgi:hypothetical protein
LARRVITPLQQPEACREIQMTKATDSDSGASINVPALAAERSLRPKSIFASDLNPICPVHPCCEKYSASVVGQISGLNPAVSPE